MKYAHSVRSVQENAGFIMLIGILIVGAFGLAIALALIVNSTDADLTSATILRSHRARAYADACADEALQQISDSQSFTGSGSLTFSDGACQYTVTSQGGQNRTIQALGTAGDVIRKDLVIVNKIIPRITIASWQEVADF